MMAPILSVQGLIKTFPVKGSHDVVHAVNNISFELNKGEVLGLVGESSSGKTTVGRCILRLIDIDKGKIIFDGNEINNISKKEFRHQRAMMQLVFQDPYESLNPRMTIGESIEEPLILFSSMSGRERKSSVKKVLEMVRISPSLRTAYPHQLSGGQQQRVGIARAIVAKPEIIVLDEPTSALDISVRAEIINLLYQLKDELGLSYIFISHDLTAVKYISDRIAVMYLGQIVEIGKTEDIFNLQYMPYSRTLLSSVLYPDVNQKKSDFLLSGEIPSPIDLPTGCFLYSRCPLAKEYCNRSIELKEILPGRYARCIRVQEEGLKIFNTKY